jgi:hypothetical protein
MKINPTVLFWIRLVLWILVGCAIPITVFALKFGLFTVAEPAVDSLGNPIPVANISINGWGIASCILVGTYITRIVKEVSDANVGYTFMKQVWKGISSTVPLMLLFAICYFLNGVMEQMMFCLATLIICKLISYPINPLPKWRWEKLGKEDYTQLSELLTGFVKSFTKGGSS